MVVRSLTHAIKNVFVKPVTRLYPEEIMELPERFKGRHHLDIEKCVGCGICAQTCPNNCIEIVKFQSSWYPQIDYGHCLFCYLCAEMCPLNALSNTKEFELAGWDKQSVVWSPERLMKRSEK